jgi:tetratricopeptide (TPR) repeat protein
MWAKPMIAADAVAFYLGKVFLPMPLGVDYGRTPEAIFASKAAYWTWIVPAVITVLVLLSRKRALIGAWLIFLAAPAANLGLLPFDFQIVSTVADHYVYLGLLGVAIAISWVVSRWEVGRVVAVGVILVFGVVAFIQAGRWIDSYTLWRHTLRVNPGSGLAYVNLGTLYLNDGKAHEAVPLLTRAAIVDPYDPFAHLNLIRARIATGDTAGAAASAEHLVAAYRRRADFDPQLVAAVLDRFAAAIAARGDADSAQRLRDEAARLRKP